MRAFSKGEQMGPLVFRGRGRALLPASRSLALAVALSAWVFAAGCVGLTGNPSANGSSGTSGGGSGSSQLSPSSAQVSFGSVTVGSSTSQLVTLTATGSTDIKISAVTASGTGFSVSGGSNVTLAPSQSVTVSIGFQPSVAGSATGTLLISSNAANASLQIPLSGDGVSGATHSVALNWQASTSPVVGYFVFRGTSAGNLSQLNVTAVSTTSYTDKNVVNGQTYTYAVKSINANNMLSNFSNTVTVTVPN